MIDAPFFTFANLRPYFFTLFALFAMSRREQVPNSSLSLCIFLRYGFKMRIAAISVRRIKV